jgi:hypothetical protein
VCRLHVDAASSWDGSLTSTWYEIPDATTVYPLPLANNSAFFDSLYVAKYSFSFNHWDPTPDTVLQTIRSCVRNILDVEFNFASRGYIRVESLCV